MTESGGTLTAVGGSDMESRDLTDRVAGRLAYFEIPTRWWIRREPLPTNATGKVLKRELLQSWPADRDSPPF
jgi:long-chain acyl-CoA synthetase